MSSLAPHTPTSFGMALTGQTKSTITRKEQRDLQKAADTEIARLEQQDALQRHADQLSIRRADDAALERGFYVGQRMREARVLAQQVTSEPDERIQSVLVPWVELHQQVEQRIYVKTFGR